MTAETLEHRLQDNQNKNKASCVALSAKIFDLITNFINLNISKPLQD